MKEKIRNLLVAGNSTMPKTVGIFNLPALTTCLPSEWCREHCYALKGRFCWSNVKSAHKWHLRQSRRTNFVDKMVKEIKRRKFLFVRVHISGDFYSEEYIAKWAAIARACSGVIFRTNTKRIDFLQFMKNILPGNFVVRESTDYTRKHRGFYSQAAIIGTTGTENFFTCHDNCLQCMFYCWLHRDINVVTSQVR